jgi:hypothetical protein
MDKPTAGLRKRQQIRQANRMMMIWIAGISVVVGVSLVLIIFLAQKILFGEKVIFEKNKTVSVLEKNLTTVDALKGNVRVLNTNESLKATRLNDGGPPLQSVLDALPADANSTALASSLQTKLLTGVPGIVVETINVVPVGGLETTANGTSQTGTNSIGSNQISFTFSVSADANNYSSLRQVLERLEKSIRPFNITSLSVEAQGSRVIMTATGVSYYNPAQTVELTSKVIKP